jgi:probable phosphoglycerate mutase
MTTAEGGFDALAGAGTRPGGPPPAGIRTLGPPPVDATRLVLVRHGEAVCNVTGICGGRLGCRGLTDLGRVQVGALRDRLASTGELAGADALYASVLPRAVETAELLRPVVGAGGGSALPELTLECGLCELHPGEADGLSWREFTERFGTLDWDTDPGRPIAPGGESWTGFVNRVDATLSTLAERHTGQLVVAACHAGVIEASMLAKLPVAGGLAGARLQLRTRHASMTSWEIEDGRWRLLGFNDAAHHLEAVDGRPATAQQAAAQQAAAQQAAAQQAAAQQAAAQQAAAQQAAAQQA